MNRLKESEAKTSTAGGHTFVQDQSDSGKPTKGLTRSEMDGISEPQQIQEQEENKFQFESKEEENKAMMDRIKKDLDMYSKKYDN